MPNNDYEKFANLTFDDFRRMANDNSLSCYEKIGFPDSYRQGKEKYIFEDILDKLPGLDTEGKIILDIGPGCSELPLMLIDWCETHHHTLILVDSEEMLSQLPDRSFIEKIAGYYPRCENLFNNYQGKVDVIITYSVLHYIFVECNIWKFLDKSLKLMSEGGQMLIGDIPNISKRKRFFSSTSGIKFHQNFTKSQETPEINFNQVEENKIDDSVVLSIINRARIQGFDAYLVPQNSRLPMGNRREDILIFKP